MRMQPPKEIDQEDREGIKKDSRSQPAAFTRKKLPIHKKLMDPHYYCLAPVSIREGEKPSAVVAHSVTARAASRSLAAQKFEAHFLEGRSRTWPQ